MSHPVWVRGLKLIAFCIILCPRFVAPRVGAWIETVTFRLNTPFIRSHPVWVRGLKPCLPLCLFFYKRRTPCGCVD